MGIHTADAVILRQYPYRETSVLVTCLTDRFGKLKGLIKGLRTASPRYRSPMEPLTLNRIVFYDTRTSELHLISQCDLLQSFPGLTQDLEVMRLAASCVELVDVVTPSNEPHQTVFELLKQTLGRLANRDGDPLAVHLSFVLRLLRLVGFKPQLDDCVGCGQAVTNGSWSARQGGLLCDACLHEDPHAQRMAPQMLWAFSLCAESDEPVELTPAQAAAIHQRLHEFLQWHIDRPLKAMRTHQIQRTPHGGAANRRPVEPHPATAGWPDGGVELSAK